jgi:hypothetical protein
LKVEVARSDKFKALVGAIALALVVAVLAPPAVQAAVQKIKGTVTAKVKDTGGGTINSKSIQAQGLFDAPGSSGALDVRNFAGGNGFLGAGDCNGPGLPPTATVAGGAIVTGILITGTTTITVSADALPAGANPVLTFSTGAENPVETVSLGNGLKASDDIDFNCTAGTGNYVLIGQDN